MIDTAQYYFNTRVDPYAMRDAIVRRLPLELQAQTPAGDPVAARMERLLKMSRLTGKPVPDVVYRSEERLAIRMGIACRITCRDGVGEINIDVCEICVQIYFIGSEFNYAIQVIKDAVTACSPGYYIISK